MAPWPWCCNPCCNRGCKRALQDAGKASPSSQLGSSDMTAKPSRLPLKRILLAEDDESMRGFLQRALTKAGYEVIAFANGKDAHERLQEEPFSLLLTDIVMPQMDGIELARRASELDPQIKIMFITGFAAVTLNTNSRAPKNARVLSKPFHLKDLVREIDRLLAMSGDQPASNKRRTRRRASTPAARRR